MSRYVLGLDIGITSVGYGVIDVDNDLFVDYGVRLFKEGTAAENETRRTKRGSRRLKRRKSNRLNDMKNLLKKNDLYFDNYRNYNPYEMRVKGLNEKLSSKELCTAIMHITKSRGTTLEVLADESQDDEGTKAMLSKNEKESFAKILIFTHDLKGGFPCKIHNPKQRQSQNAWTGPRWSSHFFLL